MSKPTSSWNSSSASTATAGETQRKPNAKRQRGCRSSTLGNQASAETKRRAAVILEVLAGERLPSEAAASLSVSITHYYLLERKALEGLLAACQPKAKGPPGPTADQQVTRLKRELDQCRRQCQRQAALVRTTQRALGLPAAASQAAAANNGLQSRKNAGKGGQKRRRRPPTVRALRAAGTLAKNSSLPNPADELQPLPADASTGSSARAQEGR